MLLPITWKKRAVNDRNRIFASLAKISTISAILLDDEIGAAPQLAQTQPNMHRPGRKPGTREIIVRSSWIIVYRNVPVSKPTRLEILNIISTRRDRDRIRRRVIRKRL